MEIFYVKMAINARKAVSLRTVSCLTIEDIALNDKEATQSHNQTGNTQ